MKIGTVQDLQELPFGLVVTMPIYVYIYMSSFRVNFLRGLGPSAPREWTGADGPSPLRGALKTGRCSKLGAKLIQKMFKGPAIKKFVPLVVIIGVHEIPMSFWIL